MRFKPFIYQFLFFCLVTVVSEAQDFISTGFISSGGVKSDLGMYSNFGVIGGALSSDIIRSENYTNYQGFLRNSERGTGIDLLTASRQDIMIFPNPASEKVFIKTENAGIYKILVVNLSGIKMRESVNEYVIDISEFPRGFYLIKIFDKTNICIAVRKIVKQ